MVRTRKKEGYYAVQVGAVDHPKVKNVCVHVYACLCEESVCCLLQISKPVLGQFKRAKVTPKRVLQEFRVTHDALLPVGTPLTVAHFTPGQFVDVCAKRYIVTVQLPWHVCYPPPPPLSPHPPLSITLPPM